MNFKKVLPSPISGMVASPLLPSMPVTPTLPPSSVGALPTMPGTPSGVQPEANSLDDILNEIDASTKMPLPGQTTPNTPQPNFSFPPTNQNSPFSAGPNPYSNYWNQINNPIIDLPSMVNFPPMGQLGSNPILSRIPMNSQNNMIQGMGPNPNSSLPIIKQEPGLFNQNASPSAAPSSPMVSPVPPRTPVAPPQPPSQPPATSSLIAETLKKADKKRRKSSSSQKLPSASSLTPPTPTPEHQGRSRRSSLTQNSSLAALLKSSTPPTPSSIVTPPKPSSTTSGRDHVNSLFNPTSSSPTLQQSSMFQDLIKKILKQQQQKPSTPKEIQEQAQLILQNANFSRNQLSDLASLTTLTKPPVTPTPPPPTATAATPTGSGSAATSSLSSLLQSSNSNLDKHRQLLGGLGLLFQNQPPATAAAAKAAAAATKTQKQNQTKEENQTSAPQGLDAARDLLRKIKSIRETSGLIDAPPSISLSGSTPTASSSGGSTVKRERKASVTKAEPKVTKKLKIDTSAPPREPETKIVHSPNVTEVTTLETPSGTLILTPTKASAKAVAKKRKLPTGEPSRGLKSPKRIRNSSRSPVRAQHSSGSYQRPGRRSLPPAAYRGKLPQIKLTRKNGQKWTISDYIFPTTVPDSELDCTKIIEKAVQRRQRRKSGKRAPSAQKTPPPLQRAPQEGPTPSGSAVKQLPILSPAPASTSPASCTVAVISPPPLTPSTPGAPTQSVTTTPQSVESNNPPVTDTVMPSLKIKIKLSKNNNPPPTTTSSGGGGGGSGVMVRSTPRKAKREVKYTVDQWWDEDTL